MLGLFNDITDRRMTANIELEMTQMETSVAYFKLFFSICLEGKHTTATIIKCRPTKCTFVKLNLILIFTIYCEN